MKTRWRRQSRWKVESPADCVARRVAFFSIPSSWGFTFRAFFRDNYLVRDGACALALSETGACAATQGPRSESCAGACPDAGSQRRSVTCSDRTRWQSDSAFHSRPIIPPESAASNARMVARGTAAAPTRRCESKWLLGKVKRQRWWRWTVLRPPLSASSLSAQHRHC